MNKISEREMSSIYGGWDYLSPPVGETVQAIWMLQQESKGVLPKQQSGDLH